MLEFLRFLSAYPPWVGVFFLVWLAAGAGVLILAPRKSDDGKPAASNPPTQQQNFNVGNQQNAGTINNVFQSGLPSMSEETARALLDLVARQKEEADKRGEHIALLSQIVAKWAQLQKTTMNPDPTALHAVDDQIRQTLTALLGNVEARVVSSQGNALIIKTGANAFRVLYPVVMRIVPSVTFPNLPSGVVANVIENTTVGFTVIFTPPTVSIERLPTVISSAEL
jgi:hypothetical protein